MAKTAIAAKAKAVYGSFLKKADYDNLIQRNSVSAIAAFLKGTPRYAPVLAEIDEHSIHRGQLENLLNEHVFRNYIRMRKFSPGKKDGILDFYIRKSETEQVIKAIASIAAKSESFYLSLPPYIMDYLSFDPADAANCRNFKELAQVLEKNKFYKPLIPFLEAEKADINKCIIVANSCYLKWAFSAIDRDFKGKRRELLKQFLLRKTDMDNILRCYRLKKFFDEDEERIKELMLPFHYRIKPVDIDNALKNQNPTDALISLLAERCVPKNIMIDEDFPELGTMKAHYEYFRHRLALTSDETEAVFSLLVLADNERRNLQKIIEGIRYGELPSEIEKLVII